MQRIIRTIINQIQSLTAVKLRPPAIYAQWLFKYGTETGEKPGFEGNLTAGEKNIKDKLQKAFPDATEIQVADVSGGCGAMYQINIESLKFKGIRTIQQHRLVNEALAEEIKSMHGFKLSTKTPDTDKE
ncbi:unnamed protein product [Lymnaea stagnalis]|uniref:BolA-like protein 3 n=1 Tax=Lymnaea stagnalis TaxID=6523 RepID=A0AAV2H6F6_LYMST